MRYFQPKSLTWWAGFLSVVLGVLAIFRPDYGPTTELSRALSMLLGGTDSSPAGLIVMGAGLIGIRDKMERDAKIATGRNDGTDDLIKDMGK